MFFGNTRIAFLEFLRNLTPQIVFATCLVLSYLQIDLRRPQFDWDGVRNVMPILACALLFLGSVVANVTRFMESAITSNEQFDVAAQRIRARQLPVAHAFLVLLAAGWRVNRLAFAQLALVLVFSYAGVFLVAEMASHGALAAYRAVHP